MLSHSPTEEMRATEPGNNASVAAGVLSRRLSSAPLLVRNTVWNLAGQIAPMLVALVAIPPLIHQLGTERFAVLTIAWMVVGYFSLFDLGLGRALTNLVAQNLAAGDDDGLPALVWTANVAMLVLASAGALVFLLASPWLVHSALRVPVALQHETLLSLYVLGACIPFAVSTAGFRGVLEAKQQFRKVNAARVPMGVVTFLAPLCVLPFSHSLVTMVLMLSMARAIFWLLFVTLVLRDMPALRHGIQFRRALLPRLLRFGGWMTISNVVSPVMVNLDRFLIGVLLSLSAVAFYATPYEISTRLLIIPAAIVGVLFPAFSTALISDPERARRMMRCAVTYIALALTPVVLFAVIFAHYSLLLWLGPDFAAQSTAVLRWLVIGVFVNSIAYVPFAFVQGAGRPDLTGKLHVVELPLYVVTVVVLTHRFGIEGTAMAWTVRAALDCVCLFWLAGRVGHGATRRDTVVLARGCAAECNSDASSWCD